MKYTVTVYYNENGKRLTNQFSRIEYIENKCKLSDDKIAEEIYKVIPQQLIDNIEIADSNFLDLAPGDVVKVVKQKTLSYGSETNVTIAKVVEINSHGIKLEDEKYYFGFDGKERSRKKKDVPYMEILTEEELYTYHVNVRFRELITELEAKIDSGDHYDLSNQDLEEIMMIFDRHKHDY